jgi:hypothetical protein
MATEQPRIARLLFSDARFGWLWLPLRLYLGYMWFDAGGIGLDRWLLPAVGTPWKPGHAFWPMITAKASS